MDAGSVIFAVFITVVISLIVGIASCAAGTDTQRDLAVAAKVGRYEVAGSGKGSTRFVYECQQQ